MNKWIPYCLASLIALSVAGCDRGSIGVGAGSDAKQSNGTSQSLSRSQTMTAGHRREANISTPAYTVISQAVREVASGLPARLIGGAAKYPADVYAPVLLVAHPPSVLGPIVTSLQLQLHAGTSKPDGNAASVSAIKKAYATQQSRLFAVGTAVGAVGAPAAAIKKWYAGYGVADPGSASYVATELAVGEALYAIKPALGWPDLGVTDDNVRFARRKAMAVFFADTLFAELYQRAAADSLHDPAAARHAIAHALVAMTPADLDRVWHAAESELKADNADGLINMNESGVPGAQWTAGTVSFVLTGSGPDVSVAGASFFGGAGGAIAGSRREFQVASLLGADQSESSDLSQSQQQSQSSTSDARVGIK